MKKKLIIGSIIAVFLLVMFPSISALEYKEVEKAQEELLIKLLEENNLDPKQQGIIKKLWRLILRLILKIIILPLKIVKIFLRLIIKIFRLPFKIFWSILDLFTPC